MYSEEYFVFQASWAAFTLIWAVSRVKGGNGGLDSVAMLTSGNFTELEGSDPRPFRLTEYSESNQNRLCRDIYYFKD